MEYPHRQLCFDSDLIVSFLCVFVSLFINLFLNSITFMCMDNIFLCFLHQCYLLLVDK